MKKKLSALLLALALTCSLAVPVLAQTDSSQEESSSSSSEETSSEAQGEGDMPLEDNATDGEEVIREGVDAVNPPAAETMPATDGLGLDPALTETPVPEGERAGQQQNFFDTPSEALLMEVGEITNPAVAVVTAITQDKALATGLFPGEPGESIVFEAELRSGEYAGSTVSAIQRLDTVTNRFYRTVQVGDEVYLTLFRDEGSYAVRGRMSTYRRVEIVYIVAAISLLLLCFLCRRLSGLKMAASVGAALLVLGYVFLPLIRMGAPMLLAGILAAILMVALATLLLYGIKYRTLTATLGACLALATSAILVLLTQELLKVSGILSVDRLRTFYNQRLPTDLAGLLLCGVLLSAVGGVVVIANITAAGGDPRLQTDRQQGGITPPVVFRTAFSRGTAALAPVVMTLSFAAIGYMLFSVTLLSIGGMPLARILSDELVVAELLRIFSAILGLMSVIPITAALSSLVLKLRLTKDGEYKEFHVSERLVAWQQSLFSSIAKKVEGTSRNAVTVSTKGKGPDAAAPPQETAPAEPSPAVYAEAAAPQSAPVLVGATAPVEGSLSEKAAVAQMESAAGEEGKQVEE